MGGLFEAGNAPFTAGLQAIGAKKNRKAQKELMQRQMEQVAQERLRQDRLGREGQQLIQGATGQGLGILADSAGGALQAVDSGANAARGAAFQFGGLSRDALTGGTRNALERIGSGFDSAKRNIRAGSSAASGELQRALSGGQSALQQALGSVDLQAALQADPGFQFEREQGEQAINRAFAARGGRGGGAALKELTKFSQGLASTRANDIFQRRFAERGQNLQAGSQSAALEQATGRAMADNAFRGRAAQADLNTQGALQQAGLEAQLGSALGSSLQRQGDVIGAAGQNQFQNRANILTGFGSQGASLLQQGAQGQANALNNLAAANAGLTQTALPIGQNVANSAGQEFLIGAQGLANTARGVGSAVNTGLSIASNAAFG